MMTINILNLPEYNVISVKNTDVDYHIQAERNASPDKCTHCHSQELVGFGKREQLVKDLPIHGKRVGIYIAVRRFKCKSCTRTFSENLPQIDTERFMTKRLADWIGKEAVKRTFTSISEEIGVVEGTVRKIFKEFVGKLDQVIDFETPEWMGIDEIHLIKPRGVITNIKNNTVVEVLSDRNKKTIIEYLSGLKNKDNIKYVAMDMWRPYRDAVELVLPHAQIVIDKFHVVRLANDGLETARKSLRADLNAKQRRGLMHDRFVLLKRNNQLSEQERLNLDGWVKNYPILGEAYRLKEEFFEIYSSETRQEAMDKYERWLKSIPPELGNAFTPLRSAMQNWLPYIMSYFYHPISNAYTESLNNLIRVTNRMGRGYSFEALRAKILYSQGTHRVVRDRPRFERMDRDYMGYGFQGFEGLETKRNYGADISTLIKLIESGSI